MAWITTELESKTLGMPVELELLIPQPGYKSLKQKDNFKVIILLHGAHNDRTEWLLKSPIFELVKEEPIVVVMPSAKNSFYANSVTNMNYRDYITVELPEFIKNHFRVSDRREDWLIAGESMGGYGALMCGLSAPETFGQIASFSGALDIDAISQGPMALPTIQFEYIFGKDREALLNSDYNIFKKAKELALNYEKNGMRERLPRLFLCCGLSDGLLSMTKDFYEIVKNDYDTECSYAEGNHNFLYWNSVLPDMLDWFVETSLKVGVAP